ncbi:transcription factor kayak [Anopheles maculipalpis]|uniref:transcription factor kayak n=1 Tax=Anopheles maculipalpis TaxID=1496333 RepID=UPI0021597FD0|nr:transcription factor kayak [Anopheles maculipalpis]
MMKNHSKTASGAYEDHSQFESDDSNSSSTENTQDSSRSYGTTRHQQPPQQMAPEIPVADSSESGRNLNKQPVTLDLSIHAPSQALSNILISRPFASFDGIGVHSGVPTRTTPTLTPTTLKNIEQTFMEATNDAQINLPYQAGFVPPSYPMEDHSQDGGASQESLSTNSNGSWAVSGSHGYTGDDHDSKSSASMEQPATGTRSRRSALTGGTDENGKHEPGSSTFAIGTSGGTGTGSRTGGGRRNVGGRRPHKPSNLTPEEEEKRRIRRERNKQAAARCRRRREDHTNELVDETDQLEKKRQSLAQEIQQLQQEKDDLEFLLETHREHCRLQARRSPIDLKPAELDSSGFENTATFVLPKIKTEPDDEFIAAQQQNQPPNQLQEQLATEAAEHGTISKKLKLSNAHSDSLETPTLISSAFAPLAGVGLAGSNKPSATIAGNNGGRPTRPDSLDVKSAAQYPLIARSGEGGGGGSLGISTPSSGLFNFDSLMEGGTGLTPIAAPISFPPNRNPLELITPTSTEPSKLCSL